MDGPPTPRRLVSIAAPPAVLAASVLLGFAGLVADPGALIVDGDRPWVDEWHRPGDRPIGNDLTGLFLPRFLWQGEHWRATGRAPLWDPRGFAGRPNAGNPQAGPWYPPAMIAWASGAPSALGWLTVAHLLGAGSGMFALGRAVGLGRSAATASGVVLMLNPYVIAQVHEGHLPHAWAACWFPWAFLGAVLTRRGDRRGLLLLPPSLALSLMAGHPQEGAYLASALASWAAIDAAGEAIRRCRPGGVPPRPRRIAARWALALGLAAGLAAVEWVPVALARPWAAGTLGGAGGGGSGPYHLLPSNLSQLVSPRALGGPADSFGRGNHWETLLSIGWAPLVLAAVGAAGHPDRRGVRAWGALLLLSLIHASGDALGLSRLVAAVPGLGGLRVPARSLFLAAPAAAALAGMGVDAIARTLDRDRAARRARRFAAAVVLLALIVVAGLAAGRIGDEPGEGAAIGPADRWVSACARIAGDRITIASIAAVGAALAWHSRRPGGGRWASGAIVAVAIAELAASAAFALPLAPPGRFLAPDAVSEALDRVRPAGPSRVRARDGFYTDLLAWRDGLEKTNLNDLFQLRHAAELYRVLYPLFDEPDPGPVPALDPPLARVMLDRLGVDLIVTDRPIRLEVGPAVASGVRDGTPFAVIANPTALPRAYVVPRAEVVGGGETLKRLPEVDPRSAVLLEADPLRGLGGPRQPFSPARYEPITADRLLIRASTEAPGLLVVLDAWMPGWSASVGGRAAPMLRGDHAFRVVPLPEPGTHEILLSYRPPGLAAGSAITAGSALILLLVAARGGRSRPR